MTSSLRHFQDWISMFDGVVDIGVEHVNGMGKQRIVTNYVPKIIFWKLSLKPKKVDIRIGNQTGILKKKLNEIKIIIQ